jgi:hypothetical protein
LELIKRFNLNSKQIEEVTSYYMDDIKMGFSSGDSVKSVVDSFVKDGKLALKR